MFGKKRFEKSKKRLDKSERLLYNEQVTSQAKVVNRIIEIKKGCVVYVVLKVRKVLSKRNVPP